MSSVDQRIVQMKFDNQKFEEGAQKTLGTLDKLKESLNFEGASKGMDGLEKAARGFSLDGIGNAIDTVNNRFSVMGTFASRIIENIADSAYQAGARMVQSLTQPISSAVEQIKTGGLNRALNLEHARFQLGGLLDTAEEVEAVMGEGGPVQNAVSGTAYGLDEAAVVASQFVASGLRDLDEMETALTAVSGVAAMTGSEYADIGRIFTTISGNGRLYADQLQQLSARGINAAATLANYLDMTEEDVRIAVKEGEVSFRLFYEAMYEAFGEHAKDANKTYTGSLANVRAALSRLGAEVQAQKLEALKDVFNALRPVIDGVHKALMPVIEDINDKLAKASEWAVGKLEGMMDSFDDLEYIFSTVWASILNVGDVIWSVIKPIGEAFLEVFPPKTLEDVKDFADGLFYLTAKMEISSDAAEVLKGVFKSLFTIIKL